MAGAEDAEAASHTAEHIFMRALTKRIEVRPVSVQHRGWFGKVVVLGEEPTWPIVAEALQEANKVIAENRRVLEYTFPSLEEAKKRFPYLRAYEERIKPPVRVIEVEGYDWTACARRHSESSGYARILIVDKIVSLSKNRYEIRFVAGDAALKALSMLLRESGLLSKSLNADMYNLYEPVKQLLDKLSEMKARIRDLSRQLVEGYKLVKSTSGKPVRLVRSPSIDLKGLGEKAVELASVAGECIIVVRDENSVSRVLLACPKTSGLNASAILRSVLSELDGKGGGRPELATGSLRKEVVERFVEALLARI